MNKKEHGESEPASVEILEDSQTQHEPADKTERVQMGVKGQEKDSVLGDVSNN